MENKALNYETKNLPGELWKKIDSYPYMISNLGRVKSLERYIPIKSNRKNLKKPIKKFIRERILKLRVCVNNKREQPRPYYFVTLCNHEQQKNFRVSRLVAKYFVENPDNKQFVNHINNDSLDNHYSNLEWVTTSENLKHAYAIGARAKKHNCHGNNKLNDNIVFDILKDLDKGMIRKDIELKYNISSSTVSAIAIGTAWKHVYKAYRITNKDRSFKYNPRGESNFTSKLTEDIVREIRASNESFTSLAKKYGVSRYCVSAAKKGITWKHVI